MNLEFVKMHGLGNDFMVVDGISQPYEFHRNIVQRLASRHKGIGFDQLLVVEPPINPETDFHFRIFNADGSEAEQCGNGMRCLAKFVRENGLTWKNKIKASTISGPVTMTLEKSGLVSVLMGVPKFAPEDIPLRRDEQADIYQITTPSGQQEFVSLSMGNPHAMVFVDDVDNLAIDTLGPEIGTHEDFPEQVNVSFIQIVNDEQIRIRVFERGSGETLACGSGACASMVAAHLQGHCSNNIRVDLPGGHLFIRWPDKHKSVQMTGPATTVFKGQIRV
ncbi:MAG: diaminopimelate epimerase [Gammaproteobacteria bacterium]|jgi:diaminopimelate epimerase